MKKLLRCLTLSVILTSLLLSSCGPKSAPQQPPSAPGVATTPSQGSTGKLPQAISIITLSVGGSSYIMGAGVAQVVEKYTGVKVAVEPTSTFLAQGTIMAAGQGEVGVWDACEEYWAYHKEQLYPTNVDLRHLISGHDLQLSFVTSPKTGIKSVTDLKGKKVSLIGPGQTMNELGPRAIFKAYGMDWEKDATVLYVPGGTPGIRAIIEGKADAYFGTAAGSKMRDLETAVGSYVVPIDPEKVNIMKKELPFLVSSTMSGKAPGLHVDTPMIAWKQGLASMANISDELAYAIVKAVLEHNEELNTIHVNFKMWDLKSSVLDPPIPFHPGAVKYYKEKGIWTPELDALQKTLAASK
ncbi:MAG: TAXI family TRAP transporter solute-binding subunit [Dehalococcoidia bacterium]|nr:TAXI family TRAP transporter solute-binding subunit [Dehalococcoidia bacterium]